MTDAMYDLLFIIRSITEVITMIVIIATCRRYIKIKRRASKNAQI